MTEPIRSTRTAPTKDYQTLLAEEIGRVAHDAYSIAVHPPAEDGAIKVTIDGEEWLVTSPARSLRALEFLNDEQGVAAVREAL